MLIDNNTNESSHLKPVDVELTPFPNPANGDELFLDITVPESNKELIVELIDKEGRVVANALKGNVIKGIFREKINIKNIYNGLYVIKVSIGDKLTFKKIMILK